MWKKELDSTLNTKKKSRLYSSSFLIISKVILTDYKVKIKKTSYG